MAKPAKKTSAGDYEGPLSAYFPQVEVRTKCTVAHDGGQRTSLNSVAVEGRGCARDEVLPALLKLWKGWTPGGGSSDADVVRTVTELVGAFSQALAVDVLVGAEAPADLVQALRGRRGDFPAYHPPQVVIYPLDDGQRVVIASYFVRGQVGMRGRSWSYRVEAFNLRDGSPFYVRHADDDEPIASPQPTSTQIPRPQSFSERDGR